MAKIRIDNQIESALPSGYKVIGKKDGETDWTGQDPKQVSPTTWIADDAGIYENTPGQFEIPSLPFAKDVDTVFSRGGKVFKYNAGGGYFELVFDSVGQVVEGSETDIATFAANSGNYSFNSGDVVAIPDGGGGYNLFLYNGGSKTDTNSYLPLNVSQVDWGQVNNTPTTLAGYGITDAATSAQGALADTAIQPGDGISKLNNDSEYIDAARANMNINTIGVTTWDRDTGVLTWGKCYIYTNKVQRWILDPGSITLSSGRSVVLTANSDGTFSDPNAVPNLGTVYLCNVASASNFSSQKYYLIGSAYVNTSLGGLSWDPLYNAFVPAITIPNSPTYLQWNNVGVNKSSIASFINRRSTQDVNDINLLNVIIAGSSTVGRVGNGDGTPDPPYSPEFATKNYPPAGYKQGLSKVLYDNLKFENQDIEYIPHDNLNWIFSGDWVDVERVDKHKLKRTSTQGDYCEITVTGCVHFRLVCENWKPSIQNGCDISIQVDVNSTGFVTPSSLSIGPDSYDLNTGKAYAEKFFRIYFGELDASDTYTFRFTKNDAGDGEFGVWGAEHWTGKNLIVYNTGWGGYNTLNMLENYAGLLGSENIQPDVIFFVMTVSNDISRAKGGYPISSIQSQVDDLCRYLSELDVEVLTFIQHPLTSADNPSDADYEIGQLITNIHRSSAAKYGLGCVDMFEKGIIAFGNGEEWRYDATHLVSKGIDAYIEEINRIVFSNTNGSSNTIKQCKYGTVLSGESRTVTFDKPYLGTPRVEIQPYNDGTAPEFMYISSVTKNGFEVSGNGAFFWKSYPV